MQPYQQRMRSPGMQCGQPQFNMNGLPPQTPSFNPQRPPPQAPYYNQQWPPALPETFGVPMNNTQWQPRGQGGQNYNNNHHIQPGGPNNHNNIPPGGPNNNHHMQPGGPNNNHNNIPPGGPNNNHHIQPGGPNNNHNNIPPGGPNNSNHIQPGGQNYNNNNNNNFFGSGGPNHNNNNNNHMSQIRPPPNFPPNNQCGPMFNPRGQNRPMGRPQFNNHGNQGQHRGQTPGGGPPRFFRSPGQNRPRFHSNQGNQQHQPNKKVKVDKRELPENNRFYCDICDRGYKDEDKYQAHIDSHERCPKEGCSYVAAGKLVQLHIKLQHNSGMAKKIWSLASQEDIAKWRDERKKNFPTAANIEKKKAELADRIARGEVIEEKYFGKMRGRNNSRGRGRGGGRGRGRGRGRFQDNMEGDSLMEDGKGDNCDIQKGDNADRKRKMEGGNDEEGGEKKLKEGESENLTIQEKMDSLAEFFVSPDSDSDSSNDSSSDSTSPSDGTQKGSSSKQELVAAGALGSLITTYSISSESEPEEVTSKDAAKQTVDPLKTNATKDEDEEEKTSPSAKSGQPKGRQQQRQRNRGPRKNHNNHFPSKVDKSLLEKLLAKEIRQERNKIMQCVHYIVKHNFFEDNKTS